VRAGGSQGGIEDRVQLNIVRGHQTWASVESKKHEERKSNNGGERKYKCRKNK
jgi:hypothetical protein